MQQVVRIHVRGDGSVSNAAHVSESIQSFSECSSGGPSGSVRKFLVTVSSQFVCVTVACTLKTTHFYIQVCTDALQQVFSGVRISILINKLKYTLENRQIIDPCW